MLDDCISIEMIAAVIQCSLIYVLWDFDKLAKDNHYMTNEMLTDLL